MQILKNRCFHYFSDFHLQEHPKGELKSNTLGQLRLKIPFEKRVEISLGFLLDFWTIWGRFGKGLGGLFGRLRATLGGSGRVLEASTRGVVDRVAPRGSQRVIWNHFEFIFIRF